MRLALLAMEHGEDVLPARERVLKAFRKTDLDGQGYVEEDELAQLLMELDASFTSSEVQRVVKSANFNTDGRISYEEFVLWMFEMDKAGRGIRRSSTKPAFEILLAQLLAVEGNRPAQDALMQQLQSQGACLIVAIEVDEPDNLRMLTIMKYVRALFEMKIWSNEVQLVKPDGHRFFVYAASAGAALSAVFSMQYLMSQLVSWMGAVCPELGPLPSPASLKAGIHDGGMLLVEGDCFGDPVNVASKLGEDLATSGQIMVSRSAVSNENDSVMQDMIGNCEMEGVQTEISGLTLDYFLITAQNPRSASVQVPSSVEVKAHMRAHGGDAVMEKRKLVILTTDMSGFTRLTKTYGILHFLRLVLKARSLMLPAMAKVGGWKVKYEGDNIIGAFPNADAAICCLKSFVEQVALYNKTREKDFQIRIGCGLDEGEVEVLGDEIIGAAFDCSFKLGEDISEAGEVLITTRIKSSGWPSTDQDTRLSEERTLEESGDKYHVLSFI